MSYGLVGRGGDAVQVKALAEALAVLGHEVRLVGPHRLEPYQFETRSGKLRSLLRSLPWWAKDFLELGLNLRALELTRHALRREKFVLAFHRAGIYDFIGIQIAKSCPLIAYLDAPFPAERAFRGEGYFKRLHTWAMRSLGQSARLIVTVSEASKEYYVGLGLPAEKILVMPNGISEKWYHWALQLARERPPLVQGPPWTIGFVGSLSPWHRVDLLLEAMSILKEDRYRLLIVGHGAAYPKLRVLAKKLRLEEKVSWLGAIPHDQVVNKIAQFDIAVLPGTLSTGAPIKLFEYAALARPTIAPNLPNLRAWFTEDEILFIKPADPQALAEAILFMCEAPEQARLRGLKAQARAAQYTWENIVRTILQNAGFMQIKQQ